MVVATTLLGSLVLVGAARGGEPSFDCGKATSWAERAICTSETLSAFDREIASLYRDARARASTAGADRLKIQQRSWIGQREQCKGKVDPTGCLLTVYQQRRTELTAAVAGRGL